MRILIVSDMHGNSAAIEAILDPFDACICMGDLVDYGPDPKGTIAWANTHAGCIVRGNHDHGVAQQVEVRVGQGYRYLSRVTRLWTRQVLSESERRYLAGLPVCRYVSLGGKRFFLVHAVPQDPLDSYLPPNKEVWARQIADVDADYVCVGHTHVPFTLEIGHKTVINPGSVGQPRDGNWQAAYAVMEDGRIELKRVDYPLQETIDRVQGMGIPERARQLATDIFRTGGSCLRGPGANSPAPDRT